MDISAFSQHDKITEMFEAQNKLIQQLQGENAQLTQQLTEANFTFNAQQKEINLLLDQLAATQAEVERLKSAISKVMPRLSLAVDPMEDADLSPEGYCDDKTCPYCVLKKALSQNKEEHGKD